MATLPTPGGDNDTWGAELNDYLSVSLAADGTLKNGVINVEDQGVAVGNTAAANTSALNTIFANITNGTETRRAVFVPNIYDIDAALTPPRRNIRIFGIHRYLSGFRQMTANTPVLLWQDEGSDAVGLSDGIVVEHLALRHALAPTNLTTQQYGIQFRPAPDGLSVSHKGYLGVRLKDLDFIYPYVGIGTWTGTGGQCPIWMSTIQDVRMRGVKHNAIRVFSDGSVGSTDTKIDGVIVHNWYNASEIVNDGPAIKLKECNGYKIGTVNIESWNGLGVEANGCDNVLFDNLRFEWYDTLTDYGRAVYLADGGYTINGLHFNSITKNHAAGWFHMLTAGTGAKITVNTITAPTISGTGPNLAALEGGGGTIIATGINLAAGATEYLASGNGTMLYGRVTVDGLPPAVDALPAASASYVGRQFRTLGVGGGTRECRETSTGVYGWVAL